MEKKYKKGSNLEITEVDERSNQSTGKMVKF